jgi:hypothetical protein
LPFAWRAAPGEQPEVIVQIEDIREGMTVYSQDGKKVGKVVSREGDDLIVEKGLIARKNYAVSLDDVERFDGERVWLRQTAAELEGAPGLAEEEAEEGGPARARRQADADLRAGGASEEDTVSVLIDEDVVPIGDDEEQPARPVGPGRRPGRR